MNESITPVSRPPLSAEEKKRRETLFELKTFLKSLAEKLRKDARSGGKEAYERFTYRCYHIAYCMLRGRTLEQVENSRLKNPPDPTSTPEIKLQSLVKRILGEVASGDFNMKKLYVIVNCDLTPAQQAVQAGHAIAQFMLRYPGVWNNQTLVLLEPTDKQRGDCWYGYCDSMQAGGVVHVAFHEPDMNFKRTAVAIYGVTAPKLFEQYPLLGASRKNALQRMLG